METYDYLTSQEMDEDDFFSGDKRVDVNGKMEILINDGVNDGWRECIEVDTSEHKFDTSMILYVEGNCFWFNTSGMEYSSAAMTLQQIVDLGKEAEARLKAR